MSRADQLTGYLFSGLTFWSYIRRRLHIHSPTHARRVRDRLRGEVNRLVLAGKVRPARSVRGRRTHTWAA